MASVSRCVGFSALLSSIPVRNPKRDFVSLQMSIFGKKTPDPPSCPLRGLASSRELAERGLVADTGCVSGSASMSWLSLEQSALTAAR